VLLQRARTALDDAARAGSAGDRFCLAHIAALRTAAVVFAQRGRPAAARKRLVNAWVLLERVAPDYSAWAAYFAAGAATRSAVEAGAVSCLSEQAADDELRAAAQFLHEVELSLGRLAA
jgi:hypothetical protein